MARSATVQQKPRPYDRPTPGEILAFLDEAKCTRTDLASLLRVSENSVHRWIAGSRIPSRAVSLLFFERQSLLRSGKSPFGTDWIKTR